MRYEPPVSVRPLPRTPPSFPPQIRVNPSSMDDQLVWTAQCVASHTQSYQAGVSAPPGLARIPQPPPFTRTSARMSSSELSQFPKPLAFVPLDVRSTTENPASSMMTMARLRLPASGSVATHNTHEGSTQHSPVVPQFPLVTPWSRPIWNGESAVPAPGPPPAWSAYRPENPPDFSTTPPPSFSSGTSKSPESTRTKSDGAGDTVSGHSPPASEAELFFRQATAFLQECQNFLVKTSQLNALQHGAKLASTPPTSNASPHVGAPVPPSFQPLNTHHEATDATAAWEAAIRMTEDEHAVQQEAIGDSPEALSALASSTGQRPTSPRSTTALGLTPPVQRLQTMSADETIPQATQMETAAITAAAAAAGCADSATSDAIGDKYVSHGDLAEAPLDGKQHQARRSERRVSTSTTAIARSVPADAASTSSTSEAQSGRPKSNCWTCRLRQVNCDRGEHGCQVCKNLGLRCKGYAPIRPSFMRDTVEKEEYLKLISIKVSQARESRTCQSDRGVTAPPVAPELMSESRSRNCWTCRLRHKACDGQRPACGVCEASGAHCDGYFPIRPAFMDDPAERKKRVAEIRRGEAITKSAAQKPLIMRAR